MGITMTLEFEEIVTRKDLGPEQDGNCPVGLSMKPEQFSFTLSTTSTLPGLLWSHTKDSVRDGETVKVLRDSICT